MKFLVLGASGMAGHVIATYLKEQGHKVTALTRKPITYCENIISDITNVTAVTEVITQGNYDVIVNCIGILNEEAEHNKHQAVFLNSYLPHFLSFITKDLKTKVIHMSTDCVFSGYKGNYSEADFRDGKTFYDRSKALGELENKKDLTFRNSIIGPDMNENGIGLFNWFMKQEGSIGGFTKAIWTGVTTLTLAKAMEQAAEDDLVGLYNLVNNKTITKYSLLNLFNDHFKNGIIDITKNETVVMDKSLLNTRNDFSFVVPSYEQMILEMRKWVVEHKEMYPHYYL